MSHGHEVPRPAVPQLPGTSGRSDRATGTDGVTAKMLQPSPSHPFLKTSKVLLPTRSHHSPGFEQGRD